MPETLAALTKWLLYTGGAWSAGSALAAASLRRHLAGLADSVFYTIAPAAAITLLASVLNVVMLLIRLGEDFSSDTVAAVLGTSVGLAAGLQILGAFLVCAGALSNTPPQTLLVLGALAMLGSFGVSGHASALNAALGFLAFVHVCAAAWWFAALLLLHAACGALSAKALVELVRAFSRQATAIVAVLVGAGVWLVLTLVDFRGADRFTPYARNLSVKIALAAGALAVATWNKTRLTPRLDSGDGAGARALRVSITIELLIIVAVFAATAWMTTFYSPHH